MYYTTLLMLSAETVLFIKQVFGCNQVLSELQVFRVYLFWPANAVLTVLL